MNIRALFAAPTRTAGNLVATIVNPIRQRLCESRNLAELGTLDAVILQDIGLSEAARRRVMTLRNTSGKFGRAYSSDGV